MSTEPVVFSRRGNRGTDWVLLGLLAASLSANVILLSRASQAPAPSLRQPTESAVGTTVQTLDGHTPTGSPTSLTLADGNRRTVVFVYSPQCRWCKQTWPLFQRIAANHRKEFRFLAVCLSEGSAAFPADFEVLAQPSRDSLSRLRVTSVPATFVISPSGRVEKAWAGAYRGGVGKDITSFFAVSLD